MWISLAYLSISANVRNEWLKFYDSSCERTKIASVCLQISRYSYEMIDLNTLSVVMLSYDSDMNEIISKL